MNLTEYVKARIIWLLVTSIARFEGFFKSGSRAQRNNNPGNLRNWDTNLPKDSDGFDIFPTPEKGVEALFRQVIKNINRDLTIEEFIAGKPGVYAGYSNTDQQPYIAFLSQSTGIPVSGLTIRDYSRKVVETLKRNPIS